MSKSSYGLLSATPHLDGSNKSSSPKLHGFTTRWLVVIIVAIVVIMGASWLMVEKLHKQDLDNVQAIMQDISKHYLLPTNETPALATVTDSKKVQSAFAGKVEDGDKILIYQTNRKAVVYRPSIDRIVDVEPVSIDTPPSGNTPQSPTYSTNTP
ncbi:MAG: hypothetical protein ABI220_04440 [Candidatus Saccharimonadales bacterium]